MNFEFTNGNAALTKSLALGGCGLTAADLSPVRVWQTQDFKFNMHGKYHGTDGNHYIYVFAGSPPASNMPRIFLDGTKAGTYEGTGGGMKPKHINDATSVVNANRALFVKIVKNLNV